MSKEKIMKYPVLVVEFNEPRYGYWDFGKKSGGEFEPTIVSPRMSLVDIEKEGYPKGGTIQWGCFGLNFWFNAGAGRSWKEASSIGKRMLIRKLTVPAKVSIQWKELEKW